MRLATDLIVHCSRHLPKFNPISVSGYHMRDAGCTIEQEMGFALSNACAYIESVLARGVKIDEFAPRISWIFNTQNEFFAEVAKYRALRRMWARLLKERYGAKDPKSWQLRVHVQTGGATLTAQQPENNIIRAAYQALASVLGGVQSLALSCFDEAIAIPTEKAQTLAVRTQQIIAHETGVTSEPDPLGGSPYIERLTDELEKRAMDIMETVKQAGGAVRAIETGMIQSAIDEAAYRQQQEIERKEKLVVGVNCYQEKPKGEGDSGAVKMFKLDPKSEARARENLKRLRESRDSQKYETAIQELRTAALSTEADLMPAILSAVRAEATVGEIAEELRGCFGEHLQGAKRFVDFQ
jgi:methylmalonyl-CoA mutase N-terminal domain/subunit